MTRIAAVKAFFEKDAKKVESAEMMAFWRGCNEQERAEFAESAAKQLGITLDAN